VLAASPHLPHATSWRNRDSQFHVCFRLPADKNEQLKVSVNDFRRIPVTTRTGKGFALETAPGRVTHAPTSRADDFRDWLRLRSAPGQAQRRTRRWIRRLSKWSQQAAGTRARATRTRNRQRVDAGSSSALRHAGASRGANRARARRRI